MSQYLKHQLNTADSDTLFRIDNKYPILFSLISFVCGFIVTTYITQGKVEVISQKLDQQQIIINDLSKRVADISYNQDKLIQTGQVYGISTSSSSLKKEANK